MQGSFSVWTDHKKGHAKVKDLARFKPMQRHLFLHEKAVLFCKKREENGEGYEKAPSYSYKQSLNVSRACFQQLQTFLALAPKRRIRDLFQVVTEACSRHPPSGTGLLPLNVGVWDLWCP